MAIETQTAVQREPATRWLTAGLLTGLVIGILTTIMIPANELREGGLLIGMPTVLGGVIENLFMSFVVMLIFAAIVSGTSLRKYTESLRSVVGLGIGYGVALWAVYGSLILPYRLRAVGVDIPFPYIDLGFLGVHLIIGAAIGVVYFYSLRWLRGPDHVDMNQASPGQSS